MNRHLFIVLLPLLAAATASAGEPFPLSASARQRYPWNGRVDVDVTFGGEAGYTYRVGISAKDMVGDTNLPVRTVWREGATSGGNPVPFTEPGTYRLIWDATSDLPAGFVAESVVVNATLTPVANPYTVRFNKNVAKATGTMADQSFVYDMGQTLSTNAFSLKGYTFSGWATDTAGSVVYGNGQQVWKLTTVSNGVVNLYAKWTPNTYSVKFNANMTGATGSMSNESFTYGTAKALTANAFAKTGYTFAGWATSATGTKAYNDKQTVSNLTATAGGTVNLYGLWTTNTYTVRFNKNASDATGSMANQGFTYDRASALRANAFTRTGYTFAGWATSTTGAKVYNDKQSVSNLTATAGATVDLYAKWTANTYSVKFNANMTGATGSMSNESFTYGTAKALTANAFAKTGYTFAGWATSATGTKAYNDKQTVSNLTATAGGTVNLYGLWTANTYTVRFNANGGSGTMANQGFTYNHASALRANAFTRTGYTFAGWALSAAGAKTYNDQQSVSNLTATAETTVDLYAVWEKSVNDKLYMIIDLSRGSSALSYPVSYLSEVPAGGWTEQYYTTKLVLRYIEPGTYMMGSPLTENGRSSNETQHQVTLTKPFYIGVFACSQKHWELVTGTNPITYEALIKDTIAQVEVSFNDIRGSSQGAQWPASNSVDTSSFLGKLRRRTGLTIDLPTEAQWEYACRAGTTTSFNNGVDLPSSNVQDNSSFIYNNYFMSCSLYMGSPMHFKPRAVYLGEPNDWGLYMMHGNVHEWCLDWYMSNLGSNPATDPKGPNSGSERVCRGGCSWDYSEKCRSASRSSASPSYAYAFDGVSHYNPATWESTIHAIGVRVCVTLE